MRLPLPALALLAAALNGCTPSVTAAAGEGPNLFSASSTTSSPGPVGMECRGNSRSGSTQVPASLSVTVTPAGRMTGIFTNNGTRYRAQGQTNAGAQGSKVSFSEVTLSLDSNVGGSAGASAGRVGAGVLSGTVNRDGAFDGLFLGLQGTSRTTLTCRGV